MEKIKKRWKKCGYKLTIVVTTSISLTYDYDIQSLEVFGPRESLMSCFIDGFSGVVGPSIHKESPKKSNTSLTRKINPSKDNNNKKFDHQHFFKHKVDGHTTQHNKKKNFTLIN